MFLISNLEIIVILDHSHQEVLAIFHLVHMPEINLDVAVLEEIIAIQDTTIYQAKVL